MITCIIEDLEPSQRFCTRCEKPLKRTFAWCERNCLTGEYFTSHGNVAENESQGWFPFGLDCAKRIEKDPYAARR